MHNGSAGVDGIKRRIRDWNLLEEIAKRARHERELFGHRYVFFPRWRPFHDTICAQIVEFTLGL